MGESRRQLHRRHGACAESLMRVVRVDVDEHVSRLNVRTIYLMGNGGYAVSFDYADITEGISSAQCCGARRIDVAEDVACICPEFAKRKGGRARIYSCFGLQRHQVCAADQVRIKRGTL
jgi:hypothetical protein